MRRRHVDSVVLMPYATCNDADHHPCRPPYIPNEQRCARKTSTSVLERMLYLAPARPRRAPWVVSAANVTAADKGSADSGGGGQRERVATASNQEPGAEVVMGVMGV